jgi:hypothetical protein
VTGTQTDDLVILCVQAFDAPVGAIGPIVLTVGSLSTASRLCSSSLVAETISLTFAGPRTVLKKKERTRERDGNRKNSCV